MWLKGEAGEEALDEWLSEEPLCKEDLPSELEKKPADEDKLIKESKKKIEWYLPTSENAITKKDIYIGDSQIQTLLPILPQNRLNGSTHRSFTTIT